MPRTCCNLESDFDVIAGMLVNEAVVDEYHLSDLVAVAQGYAVARRVSRLA